MKIPNADQAVIAEDKLRGYLLNFTHRRGGSKARLLVSVGFRSIWQNDLGTDYPRLRTMYPE